VERDPGLCHYTKGPLEPLIGRNLYRYGFKVVVDVLSLKEVQNYLDRDIPLSHKPVDMLESSAMVLIEVFFFDDGDFLRESFCKYLLLSVDSCMKPVAEIDKSIQRFKETLFPYLVKILTGRVGVNLGMARRGSGFGIPMFQAREIS
jgi:hypothetical protein